MKARPGALSVDVAVIGGGAAALRACLAAVQAGVRVGVISKGAFAASGCTHVIDSKIEFSVINYPMPEPDTPATYAEDLAAIGQGVKDDAHIRFFAERSIDEVQHLERLGVLGGSVGPPRRIQLAGSSHPRGLICPPRFGARVLAALWAVTPKERVTVWDRTLAVEILSDAGRATGVLCLDRGSGDLRMLAAGAVVLAAGGAGRVFSLTTNPAGLSGDGYALAYRAGAALDHMEFIQYVILTVAPIRGYFILTSVLLHGELVDEGGGRFTHDVNVATAPPSVQKPLLRDFMTWIAMRKRAAPGIRVFWDGRRVGRRAMEDRMPKTMALFRRRGLDLAERPVEIDLGAHQFLGGVATDLAARSTVDNVFAAGDVADSVQGADRINGSGIMEALVFGARAGAVAAQCGSAGHSSPARPSAYGRVSPHPLTRIAEWRKRLAQTMDQVLVVRDRSALTALERELLANLGELERGGLLGENAVTSRALHDLRSAFVTGLLVTRASLGRREDLGLFQTGRGSAHA